MKQLNCLIGAALLSMAYHPNSHAAESNQWADSVIGFSSQFGNSGDGWSAAQAKGAPNVTAYGDQPNAWAPSHSNGTKEYIALGYPSAVHAYGATIRETYGNGFVYKIDVRDTSGSWHTVWQGNDNTQPGKPADFFVRWNVTDYLVDGVKVYIDTDHNLSTWEEIDAVQLSGLDTDVIPAVSIIAPDDTASESFSSTGVFEIRRDLVLDINNPLTVDYVIQGNAENGVDYNAAAPLTGSVTIPAGKKSVALFIKPINDRTKESVEKVTLTLKENANYQIISKSNVATVTINSNE